MDTAAAIARLRAEEAARPPAERLFEDPLAALFAGGDGGEAALQLFLGIPFMRDYVRARTRFLDDAVRDALRAGLSQIVLMGAGFDTRAWRLPEIAAAGARVFEVDLPEQLARKRAVLDGAGVVFPPGLRLVGSDFTLDAWEEGLAGDLADAGFRARGGALFVWEGVLGYLPDAAVDRCVAFMAQQGGRRSRLALNYPAARLPRADLARRLGASGFVVLDDADAGAVFRRHVRAEPVAGDDVFRLAVAEIPPR